MLKISRYARGMNSMHNPSTQVLCVPTNPTLFPIKSRGHGNLQFHQLHPPRRRRESPVSRSTESRLTRPNPATNPSRAAKLTATSPLIPAFLRLSRSRRRLPLDKPGARPYLAAIPPTGTRRRISCARRLCLFGELISAEMGRWPAFLWSRRTIVWHVSRASTSRPTSASKSR